MVTQHFLVFRISSNDMIISLVVSWMQWNSSWSRAPISLITSPFHKLIYLFQGWYSTFSLSHTHPCWWIQVLQYLLLFSPIISCCFKPGGRAWTTSGGRWASLWGQTEEWFLHWSGKLRLSGELRLALLGAEARLDWAARWARPHCLWCRSDQVHLIHHQIPKSAWNEQQ